MAREQIKRTSLSAGLVIAGALREDEAVSQWVTGIVSRITDDTELPFVLYTRTNLTNTAHTGTKRCDTVNVAVQCFAESYEESVDLAESVADALDGIRGEWPEGDPQIRVRDCMLVDASEDWGADAYVQQLVFELKIETI